MIERDEVPVEAVLISALSELGVKSFSRPKVTPDMIKTIREAMNNNSLKIGFGEKNPNKRR